MRRDALQALLGDTFDAMLLTSEVARRYATGFASSAGIVYISKQQAVFYTDFRYAQAARAAVQGFAVRELGVRDTYAGVVGALIEADGTKRIALEDRTLTHDGYMRYKRALHAECTGLGDRVEQLREIKDDEEILAIVAAQRIAEQALDEVLGEIKVGVSEREIAARLTYLMLHYGAQNMSFDPIVVSGENSAKPHGVPSDRTLQNGDFITMDVGCIKNGYCSDMTRTVALGHVTEKMQTVYDTVLSAQLAGIACTKAGVAGCAVDAAARRVIADAGYAEAFGHGFGHGVGLQIHEGPNAGTSSTALLPAGAVITAEPGIYLPGEFGVRIEDMLYVVEDGCINLTEAAKKLLIL